MQPVLGEQTEKGRKVTTSMGEEIEVRTESERGGRKNTFPLAPSPHLATGRKSLYTHGVIHHVPLPSLVCKEKRGSCIVLWCDQVGNKLLGLETISLPCKRHSVGGRD